MPTCSARSPRRCAASCSGSRGCAMRRSEGGRTRSSAAGSSVTTRLPDRLQRQPEPGRPRRAEAPDHGRHAIVDQATGKTLSNGAASTSSGSTPERAEPAGRPRRSRSSSPRSSRGPVPVVTRRRAVPLPVARRPPRRSARFGGACPRRVTRPARSVRRSAASHRGSRARRVHEWRSFSICWYGAGASIAAARPRQLDRAAYGSRNFAHRTAHRDYGDGHLSRRGRTEFRYFAAGTVAGHAERTQAELTYARNLAVTNDTKYLVSFDKTANRMIVQHSGTNAALNNLPSTPFRSPSDLATQQITDFDDLPSVSQIVAFVVAQKKSATTITAVSDVEFGPLGETTQTETTVVWLGCGSSSGRRYISITIDPVTGLASIGDTTATAPVSE